MVRPTSGKIIPCENSDHNSHNPALCSDIGDISEVGEEEGLEGGRQSPSIKKNEKTKSSKTENPRKIEYYNAHKSMHSMYSDSAVKDIYDFISDDTIDLNQFACMCDSSSMFHSEDSTAAVSSSFQQ